MENLKQILESIVPSLTEEQLTKNFTVIADALMNRYCIINQGNIYRITDIEFYYYNPQIDDTRLNDSSSTVTYKRDCPAGVWYFHSSGIDLCFKSDSCRNYGGGILIRAIKNIESGTTITGPKKCYNELFDYYVDALTPTPYPYLRPIDNPEKAEIITAERVNTAKISNHHRPWRFTINK